MAKLDGWEVEVGDGLYDAYDAAYVEVVQLLSDGMLVTRRGASDSRTIKYDFFGRAKRRNGRTLYWNPPVVVLPPKSRAPWLEQRNRIAALITTTGDAQAGVQVATKDELDSPRSIAFDTEAYRRQQIRDAAEQARMADYYRRRGLTHEQ